MSHTDSEAMLAWNLRCSRRIGTVSISLVFSRCNSQSNPSSLDSEIDRMCKMINDHPFPYPPIESALNQTKFCVSSVIVERILERLLVGHSNGLKALRFFRWAGRLKKSPACNFIIDCNYSHGYSYRHSTLAYELILQILTRMCDFERAWEVLDEMQRQNAVTLRAIGLILFRYAKKRSFQETLDAFQRMETYAGELDVDVFNVLLKGFCAQKFMKEARALVNMMQARFCPNTETFNILLLGFKESAKSGVVEMFFRDMVQRGFKPDVVTYNILIDALCKDKKLDEALEVFESMKQSQCFPDLRTYTTLIHGLGLVRDSVRARQVFDDMESKGFLPDTAAYNAIISTFCNDGLAESGLLVMKEMEETGVPCNSTTYHNVFSALIKTKRNDSIHMLFDKMVSANYVPKAVTVTMLLKYFCESGQHHMAFRLWNYVMEKGCCPHGHAIDIFVAQLCYSGQLQEAYECCMDMLDRGIHPYKQTFIALQRTFRGPERLKQLLLLSEKIKMLRDFMPISTEHCFDLKMLR